MTDSGSKGAKLSEILAELKNEYRANFPQKVGRLRVMIEVKDQNGLTEEFHKLKGTGKTYGFPEVSMLCESLEAYCRAGSIDWKKLELIFSVFRRMQEAWQKDERFDLKRDPDAAKLLALKEGSTK